jgi:hypothetical protein
MSEAIRLRVRHGCGQRRAARKCLPARPARQRGWNAGFVLTAARGSITFRAVRAIRTATSSRGRWMIHHGWSRRFIFGLAAHRSGLSSPKAQHAMKLSPRPWVGLHQNPRLAPVPFKLRHYRSGTYFAVRRDWVMAARIALQETEHLQSEWSRLQCCRRARRRGSSARRRAAKNRAPGYGRVHSG